MKRVAVMQDLSCYGKCALTVALPLLSAAGCAVSVLPTAVLSTHTGGLGTPHVRDLSGDLPAVLDHWERLGLRFDGVYTGYLASPAQAELAVRAIRSLRAAGGLALCDPAMGDHGRLYAGLSADMPAAMARVCAAADVLVPNATELALLGADTPEALARRWGCRVVLTGAERAGEIGAAVTAGGAPELVLGERLPGASHGTGDLFASVLLAGLMAELPLAGAARAAVAFTHDALALTLAAGGDERAGLCFEPLLPRIGDYLK